MFLGPETGCAVVVVLCAVSPAPHCYSTKQTCSCSGHLVRGVGTGGGVGGCRPTPIKSGRGLLGGAQPVIPPNLYVYEHYSLGSSGNI